MKLPANRKTTIDPLLKSGRGFFSGAKKMTEQKSIAKRQRIITLAITAAVVLTAAAISILHITSENQPVKAVSAHPDTAEYFALASLSGKGMDLLSRAQKNPGKEISLTITPSELNAAIAMALRKNPKQLQNTSIQWQNGKLVVENTVCQLGSCCFNLRLETVPRLDCGTITAAVHSAKLGNLPLPEATLEKAIAGEITKQLKDNPGWQEKLDLIKRIQADDLGNLEITITGENLLKLIRAFSL